MDFNNFSRFQDGFQKKKLKGLISIFRYSSRTINCINPILDYPFDLHEMTNFWLSLISCTYSHSKSDVWPACSKIQQTTNHTSIQALIYILPFLIFCNLHMCCSWSSLVASTL